MKGADRQPPRPRWTASYIAARRAETVALACSLFLLIQFLVPSSALADARLLFEQAGQLKDADQCEQAIQLYEELLAISELSPELEGPSLYNSGSCYEMLGQLGKAKQLFLELTGSNGRQDLRRDALFRIAILEGQLGNQRASARRLRRLLRGRKTADDRARIHIELAGTEILLRHRRRAACHLRRAGTLLTALKEPLSPWYLARHQLLLGDLFVLESSLISLNVVSPKRVVKRLAGRGVLLQRAQQHFVAAIAKQKPLWMQAATLHLAEAFLELAREMTTIERALDTSQFRGSSKDQQHLRQWLSTRRPAMARKAFESLQLCLDVKTETGLQSAYSSACRENIDGFAMELLTGPDPTP
jgi:tetratricopeptide (TPR) repeat protein